MHRHATLPPIDGAFLLTPAAFTLGGIVLGSDGSGALALTVPRAAAERAFGFAQALTLGPSGRLAFTNVADFEIRAGAATR